MIDNSRYNLIMREYAARRLETATQVRSRTMEVIESVPGYRELDESIASYGVSAAKKMILGCMEDSSEIDSTIDHLTRMKKDLMVAAGFPSDYLEPVYVCPLCQDTGYRGDEKCTCLKKAIAESLFSENNLSALTKENNFEKLSYEFYQGEDLAHFKNAVQSCRDFVDKFTIDYNNLLFYGTVGTGKSFLSLCIAKELLERGYSVIYFSSSELFRVLSDVMFGRDDRTVLKSVRDNLYGAELLIIDDLGTELTNSASAAQLFSLLNERHIHSKPTIISTNLNLNELQERYADRIFSRLLERYSFLKISGPDVRRIQKFGQ